MLTVCVMRNTIKSNKITCQKHYSLWRQRRVSQQTTFTATTPAAHWQLLQLSYCKAGCCYCCCCKRSVSQLLLLLLLSHQKCHNCQWLQQTMSTHMHVVLANILTHTYVYIPYIYIHIYIYTKVFLICKLIFVPCSDFGIQTLARSF